ncbi:MAG: TolC family protein [bacterium]|nr:TolC family protein [bacterium]
MQTFNNKEHGEGSTMNIKSRLPVTIILMIVFSMFLAAELSIAQTSQPRVLTLDETLAIALTRSYDIKAETNTLEMSQLSLESYRRRFKTKIDFSWELPNLYSGISPIETTEGTKYIDNKYTRTRGDLTITQNLIATNGRFFIRGEYSTLDQETESFNPDLSKNITLRNEWTDRVTINFMQPLFQPNTQKMQLKRTERMLRTTEKNFETTQNHIYFNVLNSYYRLVKAKNQLEIEEENLAQEETTYNNTLNKYRAGIMAEVDALEAEVNFDNQRDATKQSDLNYRNQLQDFKKLIGLPLTENIDVESIVDIQVIEINNDKAITEALARSSALYANEMGILDQKDQIRTTKAERQINADLNLSYGLNENDDLNSQFQDNLFREFSRTNSVNLTVNIPIFDWGKNGLDVEREQVSLKDKELALENQRLVIRLQIENILNSIQSARDRMEIYEKTEDVAQKQYDINAERYNIGEITTEELYQKSVRLKNTKLNVLDSKIQYLMAVAQLNQQTYWDFMNNRTLKETLDQYMLNSDR